ncbi:MAG TPA: hypothetical protein VET51_05405 [Burkholderiales bacterium]|nr:hypothetical protein [Burkholderiales bacterium]
MNDAAIATGRRYHDALAQMLSRLAAGGPDAPGIVRKVRHLCVNAFVAVEDDYCRDQIELIELYMADLFSAAAHQRRRRGSVSAVDMLKHKIGKCLGTFEARLMSMASARRL